MIGSRLGPYEIVSPLGAGGMGEVYRARDTRLGREVAVKVLPAEVAGDPERLRRFEQEARAASALAHPNILVLFDVGQHASTSYLVTELLEGQSLRERLAGKPLPVRKAIEIGVAVARGLAAAHAKGIVHRDLKPENLFLTRDGGVKILDFGLAKLTIPEGSSESAEATTIAGATETGIVMGTVGYMAPEQVRGEAVDGRADIFSFGCVLFEMLTGRAPFALGCVLHEVLTGERAFHGTTPADTLSSILRDDPPPLDVGGIGGAIPPALGRIVRHCLEKDPADRFHSARDLAFDLESVAEQLGAGPAPVGRPAPTRPSAQGRRWAGAAVAAAIAAGALAVLTFVWSRERVESPAPTGAPSIAVLPFVNMSSDPEQEYFSDGLTEELLNLLAQIPRLQVVGRTSSFSFKGRNEDLRTIGRTLNVATVLEGSVRRSGEQLRVTAQLVNVADGFHLWSQTYERKLTDVFALQDEIAGAVAAALELELLPEGRPAPRAANPEAYNRYLLGRALMERGDTVDYVQAVEELEQSVELDPGFAAAHAALGRALGIAVEQTGRSRAEVEEGYRRAHAEVDRALELDPRLAEGYDTRGTLRRRIAWDWQGAEADLRRAIELDPNDPRSAASLGYLLAYIGRISEAVPILRRGTERDPLSPAMWRGLGDCLEWSGDLQGARAAWQRELEIYPQDGRARVRLSLLSLREHDPESALAESRLVTSEIFRLHTAALALDALGRSTEAEPLLADLIEKYPHNGAFQIAEIYALRGDSSRALDWLERAYAQRDSAMPQLAVASTLVSLRGEPRFRALLDRMNLPLPE